MRHHLDKLTAAARPWLGLDDTRTAPPQTAAVISDRFDEMSWTEVRAGARRLNEVIDELHAEHDYVPDLMRDVWSSAVRAAPELRATHEMDPSRLPNRTVVGTLLDTSEWNDLRQHTVGDPVAAAMALMSQQDRLTTILTRIKAAQEAAAQHAAAQRELTARAADVQTALEAAADDADQDGEVSAPAAQAVTTAAAAADTAQAAAVAAQAAATSAAQSSASTVRSATRALAAAAADQAERDAALMAAWGIEPGQLQRMDVDERMALAQRLRGGRLGRFTDLIGRFRQMATAQRARRVEGAPGEYVGITLGSDLTRLVPAEIAQLAVPELAADFAARFATDELMVFDTRGEERQGRGAIIACIDCSGSMANTGPDGVTSEAWAKAAALALLDQARHARPRRDFAAILFSSATQVHVLRFPARDPIALHRVLELGEHFWNGGTDFQAPLRAAVGILDQEHTDRGITRGDIVLVTDGECAVSPDWKRSWDEARTRLDFRCYGIAVRARPSATARGGVLDALTDNLRDIEDLTPSVAADLFRTI